MDILYFILGTFTGATLYAVVGVVKLTRQVKELENSTDSFDRDFNRLEETIYNNIGKDIDNTSHEISEIYRQMDSRLDKLDHRVHQNIESAERNVYDQINDINRRLETKS